MSEHNADIRDHRLVFAMVHHCGDDSVSLQIELPNDRSVLLSFDRTDGAGVTLWHGSGEQDFEWFSVEYFREWLAEAGFGQGADLDVANDEEDRVLVLLSKASHSLEELTAATNWPPLYMQGVIDRLIRHWNLPAIELLDGRYQLTKFGRSYLIRRDPPDEPPGAA